MVFLFVVYFFHFDYFVCNFPLHPADKYHKVKRAMCAINVCVSPSLENAVYMNIVNNFVTIQTKQEEGAAEGESE